jgi:hypothetical protein
LRHDALRLRQRRTDPGFDHEAPHVLAPFAPSAHVGSFTRLSVKIAPEARRYEGEIVGG